MTEEPVPFTIESFYKFLNKERLMGAKCNKCGRLTVPPKPMCTECFSKDLMWKELPRQGNLKTYTIIHVSPKQFQTQAPYGVGIVELEDGAQLPGIIRDVTFDKLQIGMKLTVHFDKETQQSEWPQWPRYYFKPT